MAGCGTYTISSGDMLGTMRGVVINGEFRFRGTRLTIENPYPDRSFIVNFNGAAVIVYPMSKVWMDYDVNLLANGSWVQIPISVTPIFEGFRPAKRIFTIYSYGDLSDIWIIQLSGGSVCLM